jgi:Uri superfamily endonuclease
MRREAGTYALILRSATRGELQVGRWGRLGLEVGYYIYVGSALGPGGVRARVLRHCRDRKPLHWHIDYLRQRVEPVCVWYRHSTANLEHRWARAAGELPSMSPIEGFGCSDCRCRAHLYRSGTRPDLAQFARAVGGSLESWSPA